MVDELHFDGLGDQLLNLINSNSKPRKPHDPDDDDDDVPDHGNTRRLYSFRNRLTSALVSGMYGWRFKMNFRMTPTSYDSFEAEFGPLLMSPGSPNLQTIPVRTCLLSFLHFIAGNGTYWSIANIHGFSESTACSIIHRVADAIYSVKDLYIQFPGSERCLEIAEGFRDISGFPPILCGALDGTTVEIRVPADKARLYYSRKSRKSLNVQAMCDHQQRIIFLSCVLPGRSHDTAALRETDLYQAFQIQGFRPFPCAVIAGDCGYPTKLPWLATPFPHSGLEEENEENQRRRKFNLKFCRARVLIENCFGSLKSRFRILSNGMRLRDIQKSAEMVHVTACIFNFLQSIGDECVFDHILDMTQQEDELIGRHASNMQGDGFEQPPHEIPTNQLLLQQYQATYFS